MCLLYAVLLFCRCYQIITVIVILIVLAMKVFFVLSPVRTHISVCFNHPHIFLFTSSLFSSFHAEGKRDHMITLYFNWSNDRPTVIFY